MVGREGYSWSSVSSLSSLRGAEGPSLSSSARCWTRVVRDCSTCRYRSKLVENFHFNSTARFSEQKGKKFAG